VEPDNQKFFAMVARQMLAEIRHAAKIDAPSGEKAAFADFARSWEIEKDAP
jgi:dihydrodipicolinate reductase